MDRKKSEIKAKTKTDAPKGMYLRLFSKEGRDYTRYWASVSTPVIKDGKETGDYYQANIPVRMSKTAQETFDAICVDTHNPEIMMATVYATEYWLKASYGSENDIIVLFINSMDEATKN